MKYWKEFIFFSALLFVLVSLLIAKIPIIANPVEVGGNWVGGDYQLVWSTRVMNGEPLYPSEGSIYANRIIAHSPIYFLLWGYTGRIIGMSMNIGLVISFISVLLIGLFLYLITTRLTRNRFVGLVPPVLFLSSFIVRMWSVAPTPDMLALLFTVIGIYLVVRYKVLYAIPLFALAVFTKQTYVAAPIAVAIYLLVRDRRQCLPYLGIMVTSVLAPFLIANYFTSGEFYRHLVIFPMQSGGSGGINWRSVPDSILLVTMLSLVPLGVGMGGWIYNLTRRNIGLVEIWFPSAFIIMALTIGKPGAAVNYGLEVVVASCIMGGLLVNAVPERGLSSIVSRSILMSKVRE